MDKTIVALATAHGVGSIAIVRLSGSSAYEIALRVTKAVSLTPRHAHLKRLFTQEGTLLDEAIVIYFQAPFSFTGEDVVEFQCHGGSMVASLVIDALLALNATLAEPGEFSKRAFLNGRIDLTQAQAIATLIEAKSQDAARILAQQMKGSLKTFIEQIRHELLELLAFSEVTIDYAEEDLPDDLTQQMHTRLERIAATLENSAQTSLQRQVLIEGYKVAIVGKPNVGKSSLLNLLLSYERAIVSDIAGTTRDTIEERIQIGTHLLRIIDTAGIRHTQDSIEQIGISRSKQAILEADIIIALFDGSKPLDSQDEAILELLDSHNHKKQLLVMNKVDLPQLLDRSRFGHTPLLEISCKAHPHALIEALKELMELHNSYEDQMLISKHQIDAVLRAVASIKEASQPLLDGALEFFSFHLNAALKAISDITRPYEYDQMLDEMFGSFCLGK